MGVNRVYLTEAGARIAMYCQHNDMAVDFTKFGVGDGENLNPETATAMTHEVTTFNVNRVKAIGAGNYRISGDMPNTALSADLTYRELCLYATDPENGGEVIYCYGNAKGKDFDFTEIIPAFDTSSAYSSRKFEIDLFLENDRGANITIKVDNVESSLIADLSNDVEELRLALEENTGQAVFEKLEHREYNSVNPAGVTSWVLFADVSAFYADNNAEKLKYGFTGFAYVYRNGGWLNEDAMRLVGCVSYQNKASGNNDETSVKLRTDSVNTMPVVVDYNGKKYLALKCNGSNHVIHMMGYFANCLEKGKEILLNNQDAGTLPAGLAVIATGKLFDFQGNAATATEAVTATKAKGLTVAGTNGVTIDTDTVPFWVGKGSCVWYISKAGQINGQPSNFGVLLNYVASNGNDVHQMWLEQGNGPIYHRSGNASISFSTWKEMLDSDNIGESAKIKEIEARLTALEGGA